MVDKLRDVEPEGPTEFSWGRGIQAPTSLGAVPSNREAHRALLKVDQESEDPGAVASYEHYIREG